MRTYKITRMGNYTTIPKWAQHDCQNYPSNRIELEWTVVFGTPPIVLTDANLKVLEMAQPPARTEHQMAPDLADMTVAEPGPRDEAAIERSDSPSGGLAEVEYEAAVVPDDELPHSPWFDLQRMGELHASALILRVQGRHIVDGDVDIQVFIALLYLPTGVRLIGEFEMDNNTVALNCRVEITVGESRSEAEFLHVKGTGRP